MDDQKPAISQGMPEQDKSAQAEPEHPCPEEVRQSTPIPPSEVKPAAAIQNVPASRDNSAEREGWTVLLVEDNKTTRQEIMDYFADMKIDGKPLFFHEIGEWREAYWLIRERKADLVVLDVYRGEARVGGEKVGERVLNRIRETGFVPVILYTNLPEGLAENVNEFVRLVPKLDGLPALRKEVESLFATKVPQMHRAIVNQMDRSLCNYMWGFVVGEWDSLKEIADKPEFLRLLVQRLAISIVREGIDPAVTEVFGHPHDPPNPEGKIHPAEMYIKPPIGPDPLLGDIRVRTRDGVKEYLVVVWPSCDMVSVGGRTPKTEKVLCVRAGLFQETGEVVQLREARSGNAEKRVIKLIMNNRDSNFGQADQFHFLPGICDFPDLVIDFQNTEPLTLQEVNSLPCVSTLASPFAESLASRFMRYIGRLGTPDLDVELVLQRLLQ